MLTVSIKLLKQNILNLGLCKHMYDKFKWVIDPKICMVNTVHFLITQLFKNLN